MDIKIGETYSVVPYFKKSLMETETFRHVDDDREVSIEVGWRTGSFHVRVENEEEKELLESSLGEDGDVWNADQYSNIEFCDYITATGLQIKSDPGIPVIYLGFFFLLISIISSYISYSQVWLTRKNNKILFC